jgi:predicted RNA-binding Zn ribbon-like protein
LLLRWTNDCFLATPHRTVNRTGGERYALAFFCDAKIDWPRDEIESPRLLEAWMRERRLLHRGEHVDAGDHRAALELRKTLRDFLANPPEHRPQAKQAARQLAAASRKFPLVLAVSDTAAVELAPGPGSNGLGSVLGQMIGLAQTDRLARLKTCASDECHWIFFDRSKPANRHWCSSSICGNRQKTRAYRERQR